MRPLRRYSVYRRTLPHEFVEAHEFYVGFRGDRGVEFWRDDNEAGDVVLVLAFPVDDLVAMNEVPRGGEE